jgi:hypothetical protein
MTAEQLMQNMSWEELTYWIAYKKIVANRKK